ELRSPGGPALEAAPQAAACAFAKGAAGGGGVAVRAEVRRVPRDRLRRWRRRLSPVQGREAAAPLFPRARLPTWPLRARWRASDPRRGWSRAIRCASKPTSPGGVEGEDARRRDAGVDARLRPARRRQAEAAEGAVRGATQAARVPCRRLGRTQE